MEVGLPSFVYLANPLLYRNVGVMLKWCLKWIGLLALLGTLRVFGTQFVPLSLAELIRQSELVVQGVVRAKTCQQDESGRIYTRVEIEVSEVWKGPRQPPVIQVVHGGVSSRSSLGAQSDPTSSGRMTVSQLKRLVQGGAQ